jgi:hypothetical protein
MKFKNNIDMTEKKIKNLATPTDSSDAATKGYVDAVKLDNLSDVNTNNAQNGQILSYDNTTDPLTPVWKPITVAGLGNSGVTAGNYTKVTVNEQGLVTGGNNPTTLNGYGITDAAPLSHTTATSSAHAASAISYNNEAVGGVAFPTSPNSTPTNVQQAIQNLFQYANSGKTDIATTIGSPAVATNTFAELKAFIEGDKEALSNIIKDSANFPSTKTLDELITKISTERSNIISVIGTPTSSTTKLEDISTNITTQKNRIKTFVNDNSEILQDLDNPTLEQAVDTLDKVRVFKQSPRLLKVADQFSKLLPDINLTREGKVAWSPDGIYMSVAHADSPRITIYKRDGDIFTKLNGPSTSTLPTAAGYDVSWSPNGVYMAVVASEPNLIIYKFNSNNDTFTKLDQPNILPSSDGFGVAWSPDGTYMSIAHNTNPFITIYKRNGDIFTKLDNPAIPTGTGFGVAWSPDGTYMSIAHATNPFITIYKRNGDIFTKLNNPAILPTGTAADVSWSPDGTYMSIAHATNPFITIYKRNGDIFTKLNNPAILPPADGKGVAWSPNGTYMSVTHNTSPYITIYKNDTSTITLKEKVNLDKLVITPYRLINNENITNTTVEFLTKDDSFVSDTNNSGNIEFTDSTMRIKTTNANQNKTLDQTLTLNSGSVYKFSFNLSSFNDVKITNNTNTQISYDTLPLAQLVQASGNIPFINVDSLRKVTLTATQEGTANIKVAVSVDGRNDFKAWNGFNNWVIVDKNSASNFTTNAMTVSELNAITLEQWETLRNGSSGIAFMYYLNRPSFASTNAQVDRLTINVDLNGTFYPTQGANGNEIGYVYDQNTGKLTFSFYVTDTYQINYVDTTT